MSVNIRNVTFTYLTIKFFFNQSFELIICAGSSVPEISNEPLLSQQPRVYVGSDG